MQDALEAQLSEARAAHAAEVAALGKQLEEAHALADYSSRELAGVVQASGCKVVRCAAVCQAQAGGESRRCIDGPLTATMCC